MQCINWPTAFAEIDGYLRSLSCCLLVMPQYSSEYVCYLAEMYLHLRRSLSSELLSSTVECDDLNAVVVAGTGRAILPTVKRVLSDP
jgi:hypothetical protein